MMYPRRFRLMGDLLNFVLFLLLSLRVPVNSGPPFQTDDPEPVGYRHGEVYFASQIARDARGVSGNVPAIEVNYGPFTEIQVHAIVPFVFSYSRNDGGSYGLGDLEIGVKYRFINELKVFPQVGVFPHLEYPLTHNPEETGHAMIFLPLWLQKSWGPWTSYGGGGYWIDTRQATENSWFFGWELQRDISAMLTIGAETFLATPGTEAGFNAGAIVTFFDHHHLLFSMGRDISGKNSLMSYLAYQATLGNGAER
jgi:hypothetical protein